VNEMNHSGTSNYRNNPEQTKKHPKVLFCCFDKALQ